jgi:UDP-N-acetylglucosamine 2-epimerase (non-hydrolysing)
MALKVMTIVGTRPEIIKLSRVIGELDRYVDHTLVHTGQNYDYELNEIFFQDLGLRKPDRFLNAAGASSAETIGNVIIKADAVMGELSPDALLLLGDTNSCLAVIAAKRRKIPIFHMEAGNRCFDQRVPEEINRKIIDHVSDVNLAYTEHARRYLLAEGLKAELVLKTGSPMKEVLDYHKEQIAASDVLGRLGLNNGKYFVVSAHREENIDSSENFRDLLATLDTLAKTHAQPVVVSAHPRTRKRLEEQGELGLDERIRFLKPLGFFDYVHLQMHAACVISDSGTITEESSILGFPAVTIRQAHERPEGMDEGALVMCGLKPQSVLEALRIVMQQFQRGRPACRIVGDYDTDNVSMKVLRIILSYTDYVNRVVWQKPANNRCDS